MIRITADDVANQQPDPLDQERDQAIRAIVEELTEIGYGDELDPDRHMFELVLHKLGGYLDGIREGGEGNSRDARELETTLQWIGTAFADVQKELE